MSIPNELLVLKQWVCWRLEAVEGTSKPTKVPYNALTGKHASVTDPTTWTDYETAMRAVFPNNYNGVGFVITKSDPYCFIDLDFTDDPATIAQQTKIYERFTTYSELSQSGKGLHIIARGVVPWGVHYGKIEVYSEQRYMAMTGDTERDLPIADMQDALLELHADLVKFRKAKDGRTPDEREQTLTDEDIVSIALNADNGEKFMALWNAPLGGHGYKSDSEADQALINILWFYSHNVAQVERLWKQTQLGQRAKVLKRKNYVYDTIKKAGDRDFALVPMQMIPPPIVQNSSWIAKPPVILESTIEDEVPPVEMSMELPPGLFGEIANYIYQRAPYPHPKVAIAGAIGFMSGLCGRAYNVRGSGVNTYVLVLGPSGAGKDAMHTGIDDICATVNQIVPVVKEFFDVGRVASGQGLYAHLQAQKALLWRINEFSTLLNRMTMLHASSSDVALKQAVLELFTKAAKGAYVGGAVFGDLKKNQGAVLSPSVSILGESVPERVYELLSPALIQDGTLARFILLSFDDPTVLENKYRHHVQLPPATGGSVVTLATHCLEANRVDSVTDVLLTPDALVWLEEYGHRMRVKHLALNERGIGELWSRVAVNVSRVAALIAIGINHLVPTVEVENLQWAATLVESGVITMQNRFTSGNIGNGSEEAAMHYLLKYLKRYVNPNEPSLPKGHYDPNLHAQRIVTRSHLQSAILRHTSFKHPRISPTRVFDSVVQNAIQNGVLELLNTVKGARHYRIGLNLD